MEPSTPSGLPGKARDFVVDVHNVHLDRRGGSEPLAISHSRSQMETVREPPQVRDSGFADTTSKWSGEKWGGEERGKGLPFSGHPPSDKHAESGLPCQPFLPRLCKPTPPLFSHPIVVIPGHHLPHGCSHPPCYTPCLCVLPHNIPAHVCYAHVRRPRLPGIKEPAW